MLVAIVPLVWVLYSTISKGISTVLSVTWWQNSQAGMTAFAAGGGAYHAIVGTLLQALFCAVISVLAMRRIRRGSAPGSSRWTKFGHGKTCPQGRHRE